MQKRNKIFVETAASTTKQVFVDGMVVFIWEFHELQWLFMFGFLRCRAEIVKYSNSNSPTCRQTVDSIVIQYLHISNVENQNMYESDFLSRTRLQFICFTSVLFALLKYLCKC